MSEICEEIHRYFGSMPRFRFPFDNRQIPQNGIYILFEIGESAHGTDRIVRIGTHTGKDQLRSRLQQHFVKENKNRSVFRKNIGRAMLFRDDDPFLEQWELDLTSRAEKEANKGRIDLEKQLQVEKQVSEYIRRAFSFAVLRIDEKEERLKLESRFISAISICHDCKPSENWLGLWSPKVKIRESGLWNVNELYKEPLSFYELRQLISSRI